MTSEERERIDAAVEAYGEERYRAGLQAGLEVAEKIRDWLTRQPDSARQREVREWADKVIAEARRLGKP